MHSISNPSPPSLLMYQIGEIWSNLLDSDDVAWDADFFESGGDSLNALQLLATIEKSFHISVSPLELIEGLTIRRLASLLQREVASGEIKMPQLSYDDLPSVLSGLWKPTTGGSPFSERLIAVDTTSGAILRFTRPQGGNCLPIAQAPLIARIYLDEVNRCALPATYVLVGYKESCRIAQEMALRQQFYNFTIKRIVLVRPGSKTSSQICNGVASAVRITFNAVQHLFPQLLANWAGLVPTRLFLSCSDSPKRPRYQNHFSGSAFETTMIHTDVNELVRLCGM
jgi:acyl carrier protein